jgi:tRNA U34 5-methylaminomethyl-2-thiouridine-forming methyltransferase MnmC
MTYVLKKQTSGAFAVHNRETGETMHPRLGPWEEANRVYVEGVELAGLLAGPSRAGGEVVVFDVGLGAAANALAALTCRERLAEAGDEPAPLRLVSFENDPEPLRFALAHQGQLGYLLGHEPALEALLREGRWTGAGVEWELRLGDFTRLIHEEPRRADAVFFDPFSPRTNPAMWSLPVLEAVHRCRRPGTAMRLVTYSSSMATRAALLLAGFYVGAGAPLGAGRRGTEAATEFPLLAEPLELRWLGRWKRDRDPWPCLTPARAHRKLREALQAHPQWSRFEPRAAPESGPSPGRKGRPAPRHGRGGLRKPPDLVAIGVGNPTPIAQNGGLGERVPPKAFHKAICGT